MRNSDVYSYVTNELARNEKLRDAATRKWLWTGLGWGPVMTLFHMLPDGGPPMAWVRSLVFNMTVGGLLFRWLEKRRLKRVAARLETADDQGG